MHALTAPLQDNLEYIKNPVVVEFLGFRSEDSYTERTLEDRLALYSVLNGSNQLFQAKYLTYLPAKEELLREIETQKHIYELQQENEHERSE